MTIHPIHAWILAFLVLHPLGCAGCEAPAPGKLGGAPAAPAASPAPARVATARTDILDAHVRMSTAEISTMIQAMADNGLDRVINLDGGNRADHSLDLWVAMRGEIKGRIVQCWNPPWRLLHESKGDPAPVLQDLVDAVGMFYACASVGGGVAGDGGHGASPGAPPPFPLHDPRLDPLWAKAAELKLPVYLHAPGGDPTSPAAQALTALPGRHPATRFIFTFRPPTELDALLGNHERVYVTLSAFAPSPPPLALIRRFPDRFVFASGVKIGKGITLPGGADSVPFGALRPHFDSLRAALMPLPKDIKDGVYRGNLLKIF